MLTLGRLLRRDEGNVLVTVIIVSMMVGGLASLTLATGNQADVASTKDRNHELALAVAEAGIHDGIARIEEALRTGFVGPNHTLVQNDLTGSTENGAYTVNITRQGDDFVLDAQAQVAAGLRQQRNRRVRVTLRPPPLFPDAGYALFSATNLYLKNNNQIYDGDIWANDSLWLESGGIVEGSVTSGQSWVKLEGGSRVDGYVWSGGRKCISESGTPPACTDGIAIEVGTNSTIGKWAKGSVLAPNCSGVQQGAYRIDLGSGTKVAEDLTTWGTKTGAGTVAGATNVNQCTPAAGAKPVPTFTFNPANYDDPTDPYDYFEFAGADAFNTALNDGTLNKAALEGTFVVKECDPTKTISLQGVDVAGDVMIVTNPATLCNGVTNGARINADGVSNTALDAGERSVLVLITHNRAPAGSICTDKNDANCSVVAKNHFSKFADGTCRTSFLIYADNGPVAMKNDTGPGDHELCGSVIASGIVMKNGLLLTYDPLLDRFLGFGPQTYDIARWEELPVS